MSITALETQAVALAKSNAPESVEAYNHTLDLLERKLPNDEFFNFCLSIFGEDSPKTV